MSIKIAYKNNKIKSIIDFDEKQSNSIKSLAVEVKTIIAVTTRFMKGKILMLAKTSLQNFVYDMINVFMYPEEEEVKKIFKKYEVSTCKPYQNLI